MPEQKLSRMEKILNVANILTRSGRSPFSVSDLTIEAWKIYPFDFCIDGTHGKHASDNKIISYLSGKKRGMVNGTHLLARVAPKTYQLTDLGKRYVKFLHDGMTLPPQSCGDGFRTVAARLNAVNGNHAKIPAFIRGLIDSDAAVLDRADRRGEITLTHALEFCGDDREKLLMQLAEIGECDDETIAGEARALRCLADYLGDRFAKQFAVMERTA